MRIGQAPASARQQAGGGRIDSGGGGNVPNFSGGGDGGARALFGAASALSGAANYFYEEDKKKRDFNVLKLYNQTVGEYDRWQNQMFTEAPPDGTGVSAASAQEWDKRFNGFLSAIDPDLQERYSALGEMVKQDFLLRGEQTERAALRGNSLFTIDQALNEARAELIDNPGARDAYEQRGLALIQSAPGLTEEDRRDLAESFDRGISTAFVSGALYQSGKAAIIQPSDETAFNELRDAVIFAESNGVVDAESPVGASGIMQVMPGTARDIAREIGDPNFPAGENDEVVKAYLKSSQAVGKRYGSYYLRKRLSQFNGDVEATLIAYNAGAGNARRWLDAERDYSVLPKREETEPYVRKISARLGIFLTSDTQLAGLNLTAEQKLQALSSIDVKNAGIASAQLEQQQLETNNMLTHATSAIMLDPSVYEEERRKLLIRIESSNLPAAVIEQQKVKAESALAIALAQDPEFSLGSIARQDNLTPEALSAIREEMARRKAAEDREARARVDEARRDLVANAQEQIDTGNGGREVVQALVDSSWIRYGDDNYQRLMNSYTKKWGANEKFAKGDALTDAEGNELLSNALKQGLRERAPEAVSSLMAAAESFGFLPSEARDTLRNQLNSSNIADVNFAAQAFGALADINTVYLDRLPAEDKARIALAEQLQITQVPAPQAAELLQAQRDPQRRQIMESMKKSDPKYAENAALDIDEFANTFNLRALGITFWRNANSPASILARSDLQASYDTLFDAYYSTLGNADDAKKRAMEQLSRLYRPTQVGGTQDIIYMPPELTLSNVTSAGGVERDFTPEQTANFFDAAVRREFSLDPDQKYIVRRVSGATEQAFFAGKEPPYNVFPVNDDGQIAMPPLSSPAYERIVTGEPFQFSWDAELVVRDEMQDQLDAAIRELQVGMVNNRDQAELAKLRSEIEVMQKGLAAYGE